MCCAGSAMVEMALAAPIFVLLAIGSFDFGNLALQKLTATSAARAGVQYGTLDLATAGDTGGIIQAARDDAEDAGNSLGVTTRQYTFCPGEGEVASTALCADGSFSMMYVEVTVQESYEFLMAYPGVNSPQTVQSTVRMRVR